jgi:hypothetical protein
MRSYLLDTCSFYWFVSQSKHLPSNVRHELEKTENKLYISFFTLWEMALKRNKRNDTYDDLGSELMDSIRKKSSTWIYRAFIPQNGICLHALKNWKTSKTIKTQ